MGMDGRRGCTFSGRIIAEERKETKKTIFSRLYTLHYVKQKVFILLTRISVIIVSCVISKNYLVCE